MGHLPFGQEIQHKQNSKNVTNMVRVHLVHIDTRHVIKMLIIHTRKNHTNTARVDSVRIEMGRFLRFDGEMISYHPTRVMLFFPISTWVVFTP